VIERVDKTGGRLRYRIDGHDESLELTSPMDVVKVWELLRRIDRAVTARTETTEPTGRRRCGIREHRRQIKAMQRWCTYLELRGRVHHAERRQAVLEVERERRALSDQLNAAREELRRVKGGWLCRLLSR